MGISSENAIHCKRFNRFFEIRQQNITAVIKCVNWAWQRELKVCQFLSNKLDKITLDDRSITVEHTAN